MRTASIILLLFIAGAPHPVWAKDNQGALNNTKTVNRAFKSGERLQYFVSWSKLLKAGVATMEVKRETTPQGRDIYRITSFARSAGIVSAFYRVRDRVQSVMDVKELCSLSYTVDQVHGKRKKKREMLFDHEHKTVTVTENSSKSTYEIPARAQDPLSSLYYARTRDDLAAGESIIVDIHEKDKTWSVELQYIGKETVKTSAGKFKTFKVKTYPKYEGVFQHKGEIDIWFTDDDRRIPVLMKSKVALGSIVVTLEEMKVGE
ncbi:MAG TPA: hypothetical protein DCO77_12340 [Nitrospiraceae bacterium]|nr:hypothetical protein [Nitrospiraceae bacterium]